ncbi:hypothetical protein LJK88_17620 [Paenibacillus sp. P26]|nr:hypothetical protein LJK88_17620 [Paenibacillus sp. P26]
MFLQWLEQLPESEARLSAPSGTMALMMSWAVFGARPNGARGRARCLRSGWRTMCSLSLRKVPSGSFPEMRRLSLVPNDLREPAGNRQAVLFPFCKRASVQSVFVPSRSPKRE